LWQRTLFVPIVAAILVPCGFAAPQPDVEASARVEMIGEGTISTSQDEFGAMPDKDWSTLYFARSVPTHYHYVMYVSHKQKGKWSKPEVLPFSGEYRDSDPVISDDGKTLYFVSDRPAAGLEGNRFHAWAADRTAKGWTNLRVLQGAVNEKGSTEFISFAANGDLYFTSDRNGKSFDVYCSRLVGGKYQPAETLGEAINDGRYTIEAFIAPDESYLLMGSFARDSLGNSDLYISYYQGGVWSKPLNLGRPINGKARDYSPRISPDGKYMVFSSERGFPTDKHDQPVTYREFAEQVRGNMNGLGNIYRVPLVDVLRTTPAPEGAPK
jgi:hypothetical protein